MKSRTAAWLFAVTALTSTSHIAGAASLTIECAREDLMVQGWTGPLTLSYTGGARGEIQVKSQHVSFNLLVRQTERTEMVNGVKVTATGILGSGETSSVMPDPQALMACAAASLRPELTDDADVQAMALLGCMPKVLWVPSPIPIHADVTVGLIPGDDPKVPNVIVEIRRSYKDVKTASGDSVTIETYPTICKIAGH